jgi:hypothetical protein
MGRMENLDRCGVSGLGNRRLDKAVLILIRDVLERTSLGLWDEVRRKDAGEHEQGEDLEDVLDEFVGAADVFEPREADLGDDGSELARGGTERKGSEPVVDQYTFASQKRKE